MFTCHQLADLKVQFNRCMLLCVFLPLTGLHNHNRVRWQCATLCNFTVLNGSLSCFHFRSCEMFCDAWGAQWKWVDELRRDKWCKIHVCVYVSSCVQCRVWPCYKFKWVLLKSLVGPVIHLCLWRHSHKSFVSFGTLRSHSVAQQVTFIYLLSRTWYSTISLSFWNHLRQKGLPTSTCDQGKGCP